MKQRTLFSGFTNNTNQLTSAWLFIVLRVVLGLQLFMAGLAKFGDWSAAGYLKGATGPFASFFQSLAGNGFVDALNTWGLTLIGIALILGIFMRPTSFFGAIMMTLYYFAHFEQNTAYGFIDSHIIYILIFGLFISGGFGHMLGLDGVIHLKWSKKHWLKNLLFG